MNCTRARKHYAGLFGWPVVGELRLLTEVLGELR